jgi:hypothetical protein
MDDLSVLLAAMTPDDPPGDDAAAAAGDTTAAGDPPALDPARPPVPRQRGRSPRDPAGPPPDQPGGGPLGGLIEGLVSGLVGPLTGRPPGGPASQPPHSQPPPPAQRPIRPPGPVGRVFLLGAGSCVIVLACVSVVLGIGGGPSVLRPAVHASTAGPEPTAQATRPAPPTEIAGPPVVAAHTYTLTGYPASSARRSQLAPAARELTVGREGRHLPRRGDDHLITGEVAFPLLSAPVECVDRVVLHLTLVTSRGQIGDERGSPLVAYPSALTDLAAGRIPAVVPSLDLVANRPRGDISWDGRSSELTADITELYRLWARGMPTAKGRALIPPGTPLVLAVRPGQTDVLGSWQHVYGGSDSRTPPRLTWTRAATCPSLR